MLYEKLYVQKNKLSNKSFFFSILEKFQSANKKINIKYKLNFQFVSITEFRLSDRHVMTGINFKMKINRLNKCKNEPIAYRGKVLNIKMLSEI